MGRRRREFTPEYKDEAVKLVINTARPVATVARELGVKEQTPTCSRRNGDRKSVRMTGGAMAIKRDHRFTPRS